jgi:NADPH-dependent curcumin reductase CurA
MSEKIVNYTPEQTATLVATYAANPTRETVKALAETLGKTERSVIAKLSREGVYVKQEYVNKAGEKPAKKDALVGEIAEAMHVNEDQLDGLEKAPKNVLKLILAAING